MAAKPVAHQAMSGVHHPRRARTDATNTRVSFTDADAPPEHAPKLNSASGRAFARGRLLRRIRER